MKIVAVMVRDGLSLFEFGITAEVFGIDRSDVGVGPFEYRVCTEAGPGPVRTKHTAAVTVDATHSLDGFAGADLIIVSAVAPSRCTDAERRALREAHERGATIVSLCSGVFLLADAGLLDGKRCTTHWMFADQLRHDFPLIEVVSDALYVDAGSVVSAAGTAAAIDTLLHVVRRELGNTVASTIARRMVISPHRDGNQKQYLEHSVPASSTQSLGSTLEWVRESLRDQHTVHSMAAHARVSARTFARRFQAEIGTTPHRWLTSQRILLAQGLLENSDMSVDEVAMRVGYRDADRLRLHFLDTLGTTPTRYRASFGNVRAGTARS